MPARIEINLKLNDPVGTVCNEQVEVQENSGDSVKHSVIVRHKSLDIQYRQLPLQGGTTWFGC